MHEAASCEHNESFMGFGPDQSHHSWIKERVKQFGKINHG